MVYFDVVPHFLVVNTVISVPKDRSTFNADLDSLNFVIHLYFLPVK